MTESVAFFASYDTGKIEVVGERHGPLVVHNVAHEPHTGFRVSHVATGMQVIRGSYTLADARRIAGQIGELSLDWGFTSKDNIPDSTRAGMRAFMERRDE